MPIKLLSVNIEGDKHLETVKKLINDEKADVICLMEALEHQVKMFSGSTYPYRKYAPNSVNEEGTKKSGVAILSKYPLKDVSVYYFGENPEKIPIDETETHLPLLIMARIKAQDEDYPIGAIHFSWTADGNVDDRQRGHMAKLLEYLSDKGEFVLAGDFNIPRPNGLYQVLAEKLKDNIPPEIMTSIDVHLHRVNQYSPGKLAFMVDYLWTTGKYKAENVRLISGVSDHLAVAGDILKG